MDFGLENKVFFVAASTKGIGYGIARALVNEGASVLIGGRNENELEQAVYSLKAIRNIKILGNTFDASNHDSLHSWIEFGIREFGAPDGLVVNAGGPVPGKFFDFDESDWQDAFELTLMSAVRMINMVLPYLRANGRGSVLSITSSSVKEPIGNLLLSNVMRSGVTSLMKSLSMEFGPENIRFNNLVPGRIDTERVKHLDEVNASKLSITPEEYKNKVSREIPLGRYGTIDEIGRAGAFLLSEAASYINGVTLLVDGGKTKTVW